MREPNLKLRELVNQFASSGLMDTINEKQAVLNDLDEEEKIALAEDVVIKWIVDELESKDLFSIKHQIPTLIDGRESNGFNKFLIQAVDLYAAFNGLCDEKNRRPVAFMQEIEAHFDQLNGMPELKICLFREVLNPKIDQIVLKISNKEHRVKLSKLFCSEGMIASKINAANEVKDLAEKLKSNAPWEMFTERGLNIDLFLEHEKLVNSMISEKEAIEIGKRLQNTPKELKSSVKSILHVFADAFKELNHANEDIFTTIRNSMARPSKEAILEAVDKRRGLSFFQPILPVVSDNNTANNTEAEMNAI